MGTDPRNQRGRCVAYRVSDRPRNGFPVDMEFPTYQQRGGESADWSGYSGARLRVSHHLLTGRTWRH